MLGRDADEMIAAAALALGHAADGQVVALGGAAGEDDFLGVGADRGGDRLPRVVDGVAGLVAERRATLAALPYFSSKYGSIASTTRGSTRVVAWLSM